MQNYYKTIGALAAASTLVVGNAKAEVEYELHTGYSSEYLFRGVKLGNQLIEAGADVKGKAAGLDLNAGVWYGSVDGSANLKQEVTGGNANETDLYAGAAKDLGFLTASLGYIYRQYDLGTSWNNEHGMSEDSQELAFGVSRDFGCVTASLTYYWSIANSGNDKFNTYGNVMPPAVGNNNDGYTELALSHSWVLSPCINLNVGTNLGYLVEKGQATAWTSKVSLDWGFVEHAKLSPFMEVSVPMSDDNDTVYLGSTNQFVAGAMLSVNF